MYVLHAQQWRYPIGVNSVGVGWFGLVVDVGGLEFLVFVVFRVILLLSLGEVRKNVLRYGIWGGRC